MIRRIRGIGSVLALLFFLSSGVSALALAGPPPNAVHAAYDRGIAAIVAQVAIADLKRDLDGFTGERPVLVGGSLQTIAARQTYNQPAITLATQYAYEQFVSYGLAAAYHDYEWVVNRSLAPGSTPPNKTSGSGRNVIAEKPGRVNPQRIYVLMAHLDDMPIGMRAPGADDNASGSVAVLTTARLLASHDFAYTIRFVLVTGEEQGLLGSLAYAESCAVRQDDIRGVINLDMIGYNTPHSAPIIDLYATRDVRGSPTLIHTFAAMIDAYDLRLILQRSDDPAHFPTSDQGSFLEYGYPVMIAIEDLDDFNPHYHQVADRVANLDLAYYADATRAVVAAVAYLAGFIR